jgi:predicted DsbA family dithiol-disulfide isomerase
VEWLPFDLHPEYPPEGIPRSELLARYGPELQDGVRRMVEECGYAYAPPPDRVPNSRKALEVTELARDRGLHESVHTRLMDAYWAEGADIGDEPTLLDLVAQAGLDPEDARSSLAEGRYRERVQTSTREANMHGINAIPAFVLDRRLLVLGAQPHELFERAFAQLEQTEDDAG